MRCLICGKTVVSFCSDACREHAFAEALDGKEVREFDEEVQLFSSFYETQPHYRVDICEGGNFRTGGILSQYRGGEILRGAILRFSFSGSFKINTRLRITLLRQQWERLEFNRICNAFNNSFSQDNLFYTELSGFEVEYFPDEEVVNEWFRFCIGIQYLRRKVDAKH